MADCATKLHAACDALPDFARLAADCSGDAFAAGTAVETLMASLQPKMQELARKDNPPELGRVLRSSCTSAAAAVEEQRDVLDGLAGVGFGSEPGVPGQGQNGAASRALAQRLKGDPRLRKIALLAGRFRRSVAAKHRQRVRHGADEVSDIELGDDIGRLLPSELVKLVFPKLRLVALRDLVERQAMQYSLTGKETLGRGPLVLCVDKSGSMEGDADIWATAVCLSLLELAQRERRQFAVIAFNSAVVYEIVVKAGEALPVGALFVGCSGGTNIMSAISRGLAIIADNNELQRADIVVVTDGASDTTSAPEVRARAAALGVTTLGVGIGVAPSALAPWCDTIEVVSDLSALEPRVADGLFGG